MSTRWLICLGIGLAATTPLGAQHPTELAASVASPNVGRCEMCHGSHRSTASHNLKIGNTGSLMTSELGTISLSCLRCHVSPSLRVRQREFTGQAVTTLLEGSYLGVDLTNDHPMGKVGRRELLSRARTWRDPRRDGQLMASIGRTAETSEEGLECVTCHNPHRRSTAQLSMKEQEGLCSSCHDPARYKLPGHSSLTCFDCHDVHGDAGNTTALLAERDTEILCRSCHDSGRALANPKINVAIAQPPTTPLRHGRTTGPGADSCVACHAPHR